MQSNTQKEVIELKELVHAYGKEEDHEKKELICQQIIKLMYG
jgi:hypothetical protein